MANFFTYNNKVYRVTQDSGDQLTAAEVSREDLATEAQEANADLAEFDRLNPTPQTTPAPAPEAEASETHTPIRIA